MYRRTSWPTEDHPRGCGEHTRKRNAVSGLLGSSPRMRGAPVVLVLVPLAFGIIPADAGSTRPQGQTVDLA